MSVGFVIKFKYVVEIGVVIEKIVKLFSDIFLLIFLSFIICKFFEDVNLIKVIFLLVL